MRHGLKIKKIGRNAAHRKATLQSMSIALITHKRIETTLGKAKALRVFVEPILNRAKDTSTNGRRQAFRRLQSKDAVKALYGEVASAIADRPGGYTRIVKIGQRAGDAAEMAIIEIVDFNDVRPEGAAQTKRRTRRSRSRSGADATATAPPKASAPAAETAPVAETTPADAIEATEAVDATAEEAAATDDSLVTPETAAEPSDASGAAEPPPEAEPTVRGESGNRG